jgi:predicted O-methyltransferase YrrM
VAWTAAPPGQGGHDHINEQPPAYWMSKFAKHGLAPDLESTKRVVERLKDKLRAQPWIVSSLQILRRENEQAIPHFWQNVPGLFTFPDFYAWLAEQMPRDSPSRIVEVGVHSGQSAAFLGVELMRRRRPCKIDLVDLFHGGTQMVAWNLRPIAPVLGEIIAGDSAATAARYANGTLDAVFIDADHAYESVSKDIDAWRPKLKAGGILAGHDFNPDFPGVVRAVTERFKHWEVWRGAPFGKERGYFPSWQVRV